jgi:hypothetical protein
LVKDLQGFPIQQDKIKNILVLAFTVPGQGFPDMEKDDTQEVPNSC